MSIYRSLPHHIYCKYPSYFSFRLITKHLYDLSGQMLIYFFVAGYCLRDTGLRVSIPVVPAAVPNKLAAHLVNFADQVKSLHDRTSSSTLRIPGTAPPVIS